MLVEAESTVNYVIFDLMLYCLSTWVHTSNLVLLPQLAQLLFQVYIYREMISPNEAMHKYKYKYKCKCKCKCKYIYISTIYIYIHIPLYIYTHIPLYIYIHRYIYIYR